MDEENNKSVIFIIINVIRIISFDENPVKPGNV